MKYINLFARKKRDASSHSCPSPSPNEEKACLLGANQDRTRKNDRRSTIVEEYLYLYRKTKKDLNDMKHRLKEFQRTKDIGLIKFVLLLLEKVIEGHASMLSTLEQLISEKSKRIQVLFRRRKVIHAIFLTVFVVMVLCGVIAAAMHAPPLLAALPAAATTVVSFGPLASWILKGNFWKKEEVKIKTDLETVEFMKKCSSTLMDELQKIKIMLNYLIDQQTRSASDKACMNYMELDHLMPKIGESDNQLSECCENEIARIERRWLDRLNGWAEPAGRNEEWLSYPLSCFS